MRDVRQWRDCNGTPQRQAALVEALQIAKGNKSHAAKLLGLSRQHLHRILTDPAKHGLHGVTDTSSVGDSSGDSQAGNESVTPRSGVTRNTLESLTSGHARPTLIAVSTAPAAVETDEVSVTLLIPRRCAEWLDHEAVRRKHAVRHGKSAKAPIVVELIECAMQLSEKKVK